MVIEKDHIQEKEWSIIGFLVAGSCPEATNLEDMQSLHENHSVLYGAKILCKDRAITNLASQVLKIPFKLQTKAIHILVAGANQAVDARDRYNHVFGSRNNR